MSAGDPTPLRSSRWLAAVAVSVIAGLGLVACGGAKSTTSGNAPVTTSPAAATGTTKSTGAGIPATTPAATAATGSSSDQALDQQIQNLSNSLNQVSGDLSSADKASANGG